MRADLTDVTLIVDRSGSMQSIRKDAEGGINSFVESQKAVPGELLVTLVQFDNEYEVVCQAIPVANVPYYRLQPRGATALLDAVGRCIDETGVRLAAMPESERPGLVTIVIVTDGRENSSRRYTSHRVAEMIEHQQSVYQWKFVFLSSDLNAVADAEELSIPEGALAHFNADAVGQAWHVLGDKVVAARKARALHRDVNIQFSDDERQQMQ
jgi:uncharacterized protein YegL